jgi:NAD(P)-dependent dehydrogenase (short-subunit alcohol dehydrogenase family)
MVAILAHRRGDEMALCAGIVHLHMGHSAPIGAGWGQMNEMFRLDGKTALVTGAGSGLGRHFAQVLASAGANVVIVARRKDKLTETEALISQAGGRVLSLPLDVRSAGDVDHALRQVVEDFGTIDVLVNNAGVSGFATLNDCSEDNWDSIFDTNVKAVWLVSKAVVAQTREHKQRNVAIINIASILASATKFGLGPYMASKAAVQQLTKAMAVEWAESGVRVNAIAPGYFPSEMTDGLFDTPDGLAMQRRIPMGRTGELHEISGPLLLLASDASSYMNGSTITVDGGHLCRTL